MPNYPTKTLIYRNVPFGRQIQHAILHQRARNSVDDGAPESAVNGHTDFSSLVQTSYSNIENGGMNAQEKQGESIEDEKEDQGLNAMVKTDASDAEKWMLEWIDRVEAMDASEGGMESMHGSVESDGRRDGVGNADGEGEEKGCEENEDGALVDDEVDKGWQASRLWRRMRRAMDEALRSRGDAMGERR